MNIQEVEWKHYPYVAEYSPARSFVERLVLKGKQPKTVDAYARVVEDLLTYFTKRNFFHVLEADEADLDAYIASLRQQRPKKRGRGGMVDDQIETSPFVIRRMLSDNTIAQRVVVCRLFYDFLIRNKLRSDSVNPIERGNDGRNRQHPRRGPFQKRERLPWIPSDEAWEQLLIHVIQNEPTRPKAMILLAYDAALRREELMLLRVDDIDWRVGLLPFARKSRRMDECDIFQCLREFFTWFVPTLTVTVARLSQHMMGMQVALFSCQSPPVIQDVRLPSELLTKLSNEYERK